MKLDWLIMFGQWLLGLFTEPCSIVEPTTQPITIHSANITYPGGSSSGRILSDSGCHHQSWRYPRPMETCSFIC